MKTRQGDTWKQRFSLKRCNINETVITKIPRLLPEETIIRIHERSEANKTYTHGQLKHPYLLARMIFCEECGFAIFGQAHHDGKLYYRHPRDRGCKNFNYISAHIIEGSVVNDIFRMLGNRPKIDEAIKAAIPDLEELEKLKSRIKLNEKELLKNKRAKDRLLDQVERGNISGGDIKERMVKLKEAEELLSSQIKTFKTKCESIPSKGDVTRKVKMLLVLMENILKRQKHLNDEMTFNDKRKLLQYAFSGKDADGKRCGVYVGKTINGSWIYTIKGVFYDSQGILQMIDYTDITAKSSSESPSEYWTEDDEQDMLGKRDAHYEFCFH